MGWSGGFGGGGGGFVGTHSSAQQAGLPFGGIPTELQKGVDKILATEPDHSKTQLQFTQRPTERERRRLSIAMLVKPPNDGGPEVGPFPV